MLEVERPALMVIEESRSSALGGHVLEQIKAVEGSDRSENALRQGLGAFQAAKPPVPLVSGDGGANIIGFRSIRKNQDVVQCEPACENWWTPLPLAAVEIASMVLVGPGPQGIEHCLFIITITHPRLPFPARLVADSCLYRAWCSSFLGGAP
ncbi:MAG: hypothetical protein J4F42_04720 [Desulfurellaceae bacterium]|nr:hypothetical protein [Desulfurellaceae bacterium]